MFTHIGSPVELPELSSTTLPSGIRHYIVPDGSSYPSITTMLGAKDKPWIKDWTAMLGKDKAKKEMERCAKRGTAVHELVEKYLNNEDDFMRGYDSAYIKGFNQLKFRLNNIDNIRLQEVALYSTRLKIAGRVDCIGEYEGKLSVIDFKTSNNNKSTAQITDYFIQCTFYALAWFELTGEPIEDIVILMNVEKGLVPLVFKEKIDKYVAPLLQRIDTYYEEHGA